MFRRDPAKRNTGRHPACPRCTLPTHPATPCPWCDHDQGDRRSAAELTERRAGLLALRSDGAARRRWLAESGREPFMSCPACGQWGRFGLCEHCNFDATDPVAVAALASHAEQRAVARAGRKAQRRLGSAGACPRCWLRSGDDRCGWCGHDRADEGHTAELVARREKAVDQRRLLNRDPAARRRREEALDRGPFMTCTSCRRWGRFGMCEWCDFDATDDIAVAAHERARTARTEAKRRRRADLRTRLAPPSRRAAAAAGQAAPARGPVRAADRFMTCPACHQWSTVPVCDWCDFDATDTDAVRHLTEQRVFARRHGQVRRRQLYATFRGLLRFDVGEQVDLVGHLAKWTMLGAIVGVLAGAASAGFLTSLSWATTTREAHPWLLFGLPLAGFVVGLGYHYGGGRAGQGNNLIISEIHDPKAWVPRRMAPLVYAGTVLTHLFGGSAGREGTAIQMSGSLTDGFSRVARLSTLDRRLLLIAAIAGGFGSVFGVPFAGCVFALEVQSVGRMRYDALVPALSASIVGDLVVRGLGVHHTPVPHFADVTLTAPLLAKVALAGLVFGLASVLFAELTSGVKRAFAVSMRWAPARPLIGGVLIVGLTFLVGSRDYLGLSVPLITRSLAGGAGVLAFAFALKLLFTAVTLGAGFQGGEVTPLFVIGATLGATLGHILGVPVPLMAALGFVAVFAGATNTPLACTIMGVELFGSGPMVLFAVTCVVSYVFSAHRGIYGTQRIDTPKGADSLAGAGDEDSGRVLTLTALARQRRHWLPAARHPAAATPPSSGVGGDEAAG